MPWARLITSDDVNDSDELDVASLLPTLEVELHSWSPPQPVRTDSASSSERTRPDFSRLCARMRSACFPRFQSTPQERAPRYACGKAQSRYLDSEVLSLIHI